MSTKHVILSLLDIKKMSGYDLFKNIKITLNSIWSATYSQIYPALHKMEKAGLIKGKQVPGQKSQKRIVYELTAQGEEELYEWQQEDVQYLPYRDPFKLWAIRMNDCPREVVYRNIKKHISLNREREQFFREIARSIADETHPMIVERKKQLPAEALEQIKQTRQFVFEELAKEARHEIRSARRLRKLAEALFDQPKKKS